MTHPPQEQRPNIIFLFSDQQRYDTVSCYGEPLGADFNLTPNLDRLAAQGTRFDLHMSCQPVCGPARAAIQTGKYPNGIGCHINDRRLPASEKTIAQYFTEAGYATAYVGKWHLASEHSFDPDHPQHLDYKTTAIPPELRGGYQDFWISSDVLEFTSHGNAGYMWDKDMEKRSFEKYRVDATMDFALEYIEQNKEKPYFLMVSYIEPHHQNDRNTTEGPEGSKEQYRDFTVPLDLEGTEGDWAEELPDYLGCCHSLDQAVGQIVEVLRERGELENTVIIYSSDHGSHFKTRNTEYKRSCHDSSLHVPMIAVGPGFDGGHVVKELSSLIDLAPTFLQAAGIDTPDDMHGTPMQKLVEDPATPIHQSVFVQISESGVGRALRGKEYTYSVDAKLSEVEALDTPAASVYYEEFLYDLTKDPGQKTNLVSDPAYAEVREQLRQELKQAIFENEGLEAEILPA